MKYIKTDDAPAAIGPYSQAVEHNGMVYCSGQIPIEPSSGRIEDSDIAGQTHQVLNNLKAVLHAAGMGPSNVLKTTVYLRNISDFAEMNDVYESFFAPYKPARAAVEVSRLPKDVLVEIDCIATT